MIDRRLKFALTTSAVMLGFLRAENTGAQAWPAKQAIKIAVAFPPGCSTGKDFAHLSRFATGPGGLSAARGHIGVFRHAMQALRGEFKS
jgi:hypothetical protein